jgi:RNA recognition motif-containing protein
VFFDTQADPENANVYIGNLAPDVTDAELQRHFSQFGNVVDVKIYRKGGYAFAQFASHAEAVRAIVGLSGQNLGGKALKCSWGRHQARKAQAPLESSFDYLTLQQQQMSLQQQLAMQQLGYGPAGYAAQGLSPLGMPGAPPPPHLAGPLLAQQQPQQQLTAQQQQQLAAQQLGQQFLPSPGQQQLDFSNLYYGGGMYYQ